MPQSELTNSHLFTLTSHGNTNPIKTDCEELILASDETIANISLNYSVSKGLNMIGVLTNKGNSLVKGLKV